MTEFLEKLRARFRVGVVGGSDLNKIKEQLGDDGESRVCAGRHAALLGFFLPLVSALLLLFFVQ